MHTMAAAIYSYSYHWDAVVVANFRHWLSGNGAPTPHHGHILERMFPSHLPEECVEWMRSVALQYYDYIWCDLYAI